MKAILMSVRPKWCELIASGKKTVEIRKTVPKLETPFKVYIYCTQGDALALPCLNNPHYTIYRMNNGTVNGRQMTAKEREQSDHSFANGKVIGEFVCDSFEYYTSNCTALESVLLPSPNDLAEMCLTLEEFNAYGARGKLLYGWRISDLVIYHEPKELNEFWRADKCPYASKDGCTYKYHCFRVGQTKRCGDTLTRPPQSWCYVEELAGGGAE